MDRGRRILSDIVEGVNRRRTPSNPRGGQRGSSLATVIAVATIPQKELRNNVGAVLRRAENGERLTVTVSGRPVAELGPVRARTWVPAANLSDLWKLPVDSDLAHDLGRFGAGLDDPWQR